MVKTQDQFSQGGREKGCASGNFTRGVCSDCRDHHLNNGSQNWKLRMSLNCAFHSTQPLFVAGQTGSHQLWLHKLRLSYFGSQTASNPARNFMQKRSLGFTEMALAETSTKQAYSGILGGGCGGNAADRQKTQKQQPRQLFHFLIYSLSSLSSLQLQ